MKRTTITIVTGSGPKPILGYRIGDHVTLHRPVEFLKSSTTLTWDVRKQSSRGWTITHAGTGYIIRTFKDMSFREALKLARWVAKHDRILAKITTDQPQGKHASTRALGEILVPVFDRIYCGQSVEDAVINGLETQ
jgi:hypothetical protein